MKIDNSRKIMLKLTKNEGKEEGKNEKSIEIAINGIKKGYTNEVITDLTELSGSEIEKLRNELKDNN